MFSSLWRWRWIFNEFLRKIRNDDAKNRKNVKANICVNNCNLTAICGADESLTS